MQKYTCKHTALQCFGGFMAALMKVIVSCSFLVLVLDVCFCPCLCFSCPFSFSFSRFSFSYYENEQVISLWLC